MAFGSIGERLALLIDADASGAIREIKKVGDTSQTQFSKAQTSQEKWSKGLMVGGATAVGVAAVVGAGLLKTVHAYQGYEDAELKLQNTESHMPALAGASSKAFNDLADKISRTTEVDRDGVIAGEALLGTFGLTQKQILALTPLVVDFSQKTGVNLNTAFRQVGKTVETGTNGLLRNGVVIDKTALKTNAFAATVSALSQKVGGFATTQGKTFDGRLDEIRNQLHDISEGVGKGATEQLGSMLGGVDHLTTGLGQLSTGTQAEIGKLGVIGVTAVGAAGGVALLGGAALKAKAALTVAEGEGFLGSSISGLGVAAIGAGVGLAALGVITDVFKKKASDAGKSTNDLIASMLQEGKTADEVAATTLVNYVKEHGAIENVASSLGLTMRDLAGAIAGNGDAYNKIKTNAKAYYDEQVRAEDQMVKQQHLHGDAVSNLNAEDVSRKKGIDDLIGFIDKNRKSIEEQTQKEQVAKQVASDLAHGTDEQAQSTYAAAQASKAMTDAIDKQRDAEDALTTKTLDVDDAQRTLSSDIRNITSSILDVHDKQVAWTQAVKAHGATSEIAIRAQIDYQNSIDGVGQATDDAKRAIEDLAVKETGASSAADAVKNHTAGYIAQLLKVESTLSPNSPLRIWLDQYIAELHNVPAEVTTRFNTQGGGKGTTVAGPIRHYASGGTLGAGEEGIVGDTGGAPELIEGPATVHNPAATARMLRGGGAELHVHLHVSPGFGTNAKAFMRDLADEVARDARSGGPFTIALRKARAA